MSFLLHYVGELTFLVLGLFFCALALVCALLLPHLSATLAGAAVALAGAGITVHFV